ncbi:hypothetical protein BUE80_DR002779 [Diplocarpon rosae]|nr:hypothetical protein BUE80_DR002779 [Diplocarpon rosae]
MDRLLRIMCRVPKITPRAGAAQRISTVQRISCTKYCESVGENNNVDGWPSFYCCESQIPLQVQTSLITRTSRQIHTSQSLTSVQVHTFTQLVTATVTPAPVVIHPSVVTPNASDPLTTPLGTSPLPTQSSTPLPSGYGVTSSKPVTTPSSYAVPTMPVDVSASMASAILAGVTDVPDILASGVPVSPMIIAGCILGGLLVLSLLILLSYMLIQLRSHRHKHGGEHDSEDDHHLTSEHSMKQGGFDSGSHFRTSQEHPCEAMGAATLNRTNGAAEAPEEKKNYATEKGFPLDSSRPATPADIHQRDREMGTDFSIEGYGFHGTGRRGMASTQQERQGRDMSPGRPPQGRRQRDSDLSITPVPVRPGHENIFIGIGPNQQSAGQTSAGAPVMGRMGLSDSARELRRPPPARAGANPMYRTVPVMPTTNGMRGPAPVPERSQQQRPF